MFIINVCAFKREVIERYWGLCLCAFSDTMNDKVLLFPAVEMSTVNEISNEQLYALLPNRSFLFVGIYCARDLLQNTINISAFNKANFFAFLVNSE